MLQSLPLSPLLLPKPELVWIIVPIIEAPRRDLAPTPLIFGEIVGLFLQYLQAIPPVLLFEVIPDAVPGPRRSWAPRKGEGALGCALWETDIEYLWDVVT